MKKALLFLTFFLFSVFVIAEEVQVGEYKIEDVTITLFEERKAEPEKAAEAGDKEEEVEPEDEKEKPNTVYFQPTAGLGTGSSLFSLSAEFNLGFLVAHTKRKNNFYIGLDAGFRYHPRYDNMISVPIQANFAADFKSRNGSLKYAGLWFSIGVDLNYGIDMDSYEYQYHQKADWDSFTWFDFFGEKKSFRIFPAWALGSNFVFRNNIVLRTGIYGFYGQYPNLLIAVGYRF